MEILLIGLNHRTAPVDLRERAAFSREQALRAAEELRQRQIVEEAVVLSTCNRSELYGVAREGTANPCGALECYFAGFHKLTPEEINGSLYRHSDLGAVRHLFRVAAGLDSMLLGEAEILGQVRQAYLAAFENGATGPVLNRLFQSALEVGKRVRAETELGTRPMSAAYAAVKLAEQIFGRLSGHRALIAGAGTMGEQVVEHLRNRGLTRLEVCNRSLQRAEELAARFEGRSVRWEELPEALVRPDVLIVSVAGDRPVITRAMLEAAIERRDGRALLVIDLGVPRNVEPEAASLYNLYLYNIDDLSLIVEQNKQARQEEVPRAERIIEEQIEKFRAWQAQVDGIAVLARLRAKLQHEREEFLKEHLDEMKHLSPEDRERVGRLTTELLDRILQQPADRLRGEREIKRKLQEIEAVRELFDLENRSS